MRNLSRINRQTFLDFKEAADGKKTDAFLQELLEVYADSKKPKKKAPKPKKDVVAED